MGIQWEYNGNTKTGSNLFIVYVFIFVLAKRPILLAQKYWHPWHPHLEGEG